jgi:hypothetical protein
MKLCFANLVYATYACFSVGDSSNAVKKTSVVLNEPKVQLSCNLVEGVPI